MKNLKAFNGRIFTSVVNVDSVNGKHFADTGGSQWNVVESQLQEIKPSDNFVKVTQQEQTLLAKLRHENINPLDIL